MSRDIILTVLVVGLGLFEWWGSRIDKRLEAWARGQETP